MSELAVTALKVLFLALIWVFILSIGGVIRTDLFGRTVPRSDLPTQIEPPKPNGKPRKRRGRRNRPTALVVSGGTGEGSRALLDEAPILIGRNSDCAILLDDDYVSTRHARVDNSVDGWFIEDLGSTNGTYVNAQRITVPTLIGLDDNIRIGRTHMKLEA